jgi:hypothetical protein
VAAKEQVERARQWQEEAGYQSGLLFADLADYYIQVFTHDSDQKNHLLSQIQKQLERLGVYDFLSLPVWHLEGDQGKVDRLIKDIEWLDADRVRRAAEQFGLELTR